MDIKEEIESWFPNIIGKSYKMPQVDERDYNCIAFTLDIYKWTWPSQKSWPKDIPRNPRLKSFELFYNKHGYVDYNMNHSYEKGFDKIAIYTKEGVVTHACKQFVNSWRSKCGRFIIEHQLDWLCGNTPDAYGDVSLIMKKKI